MPTPYLNASDVNTFVFCRRALHLKRLGVPSLLERERAMGTAAHQAYGKKARSSGRYRTMAVVLAATALLSVAAAATLVLLR